MADWLCLTESYKTVQQFDYFDQQFKKNVFLLAGVAQFTLDFRLYTDLMSLFSVAGLYLHFIFVLLILCSIVHPYLPPREGVSRTHIKFPA